MTKLKIKWRFIKKRLKLCLTIQQGSKPNLWSLNTGRRRHFFFRIIRNFITQERSSTYQQQKQETKAKKQHPQSRRIKTNVHQGLLRNSPWDGGKLPSKVEEAAQRAKSYARELALRGIETNLQSRKTENKRWALQMSFEINQGQGAGAICKALDHWLSAPQASLPFPLHLFFSSYQLISLI